MVDLLIYLLMWLEMLIEIMLTSTSWSMMTNVIQNNALERGKLWTTFIHFSCLMQLKRNVEEVRCQRGGPVSCPAVHRVT